MSYGTMLATTREYVLRRAAQSNVSAENLGLEPEVDENSESWPAGIHEISVVFGGALDETFYVQGMYEVNIADWIAEQCRDESERQGGESWEVTVGAPNGEDCSDIVYRVRSDD